VTDAAPDRPVYVLRVRARPGVDAVAALRQVLRRLLRGYGLICISISIEPEGPDEPTPPQLRLLRDAAEEG
jgi:hypothetical protein